ncbi:MAG: ATP-dependent sacrificial sulfur transferase LarE [Thermoleophilia bacterium]
MRNDGNMEDIGILAPAKTLNRLLDILRPMQRFVVAFSGGVDSSVVVAAAARAVGAENVLAVTARSETLPASELTGATELARILGIPHQVIETRELDRDEFRANPPDRCYHCKKELWRKIGVLAADKGISRIADGVNADDNRDFRPGIRAGDEAGVLHPLAEIGAGKADVRGLAREMELPNWDKPAQACLSSRFPYGSAITVERLERVEAAEKFLCDRGLRELRVRDHGDIARIEVPIAKLGIIAAAGEREEIVRVFKSLGYAYVVLDLEGFRSGSMNEVLIP